MIRARFVSFIALFSGIMLSFGGCVSFNDGAGDLWRVVQTVDSKLQENCRALQTVGAIAQAEYDSKKLAKVNAGLAAYCSGDPMTSPADAVIQVAKIYAATK